MTTAKSILVALAAIISIPCFGQGNNPTVPKDKRTKLDESGIAVSSDDSNVSAVPKGERQKNRELPQISVIDKLLSIESALGGLKTDTERPT